MAELSRSGLIDVLRRLIARNPVTLLLGPRQCGKTTLSRQVSRGERGAYFDLEDPETALRPETAKQVLAPLRGLVVIDEFQRQPGLFGLLRVLADRKPLPARFLILGSASPELVRGSSETLAGRVAHCEMAGLDLVEVGRKRESALWLRGGFPPSLLASSDKDSFRWRQDFVQTFLERDIPQLGIRVPAPALRRFWTMLAHYHGQIWNAAELARAMGTGETAVRHHLDILSGAFMVRQLQPWFENVGKRLVKSPKIYLRDTGLLHTLLGLRSRLELQAHPKLGASWEGFALDQVIRLLGAERDAFFYRTQAGAELDLFVIRGGRRYGFEFKHEDAPRPSKSMHVASGDLRLEEIFVVHPGERSYGMAEGMSAVAIRDVPGLIRKKRLR